MKTAFSVFSLRRRDRRPDTRNLPNPQPVMKKKIVLKLFSKVFYSFDSALYNPYVI